MDALEVEMRRGAEIRWDQDVSGSPAPAHLWIPGYVIAKPRPRVTRRNGKFHAYTPNTAAEAEYRIREAWAGAFPTPLTCPCRLAVTVYLARPKGHYGKRGLLPSAPSHPTVRPDLDNYVKTVLDALNGVAYLNDSQVVAFSARKTYAPLDFCAEGWDIYLQEIFG